MNYGMFSTDFQVKSSLYKNVKDNDRPCLHIRPRQNRVVRKFAHAQIAILASSYSDDVIVIEVRK